jgi:hypothetical protein
MIVKEGIILYHASSQIVREIDLSKCRKRNDFGQGFYVTTDKNQAEKFVKTASRKAGSSLSSGFVNVYALSVIGDLAIHEFPAVDEDWLHCVCTHRRAEGTTEDNQTWQKYDIIAGKIANDDTMTVINIYLSGGYGEYGTTEAGATAIRFLKPERLKDQLVLRTMRAISALHYDQSFEVKFQ